MEKQGITDKEKIEEIIQMSNAYHVYDVVDFDALREALREDLLELAKWKDEQLRGILEAVRDDCPRSKARHYLLLLKKNAL